MPIEDAGPSSAGAADQPAIDGPADHGADSDSDTDRHHDTDAARYADTDRHHDTDAACGGDLTLKEELDVACAIAASFQTSIQHADTKGSMLAVLVSGVVTLIVTQAGPLRAALSGAGPTAAVLVVILTVLVAALAGTGLHLAAALRPRITPPGPANRFAFPAMAGADLRRDGAPGPGDLRAEAWALNQLLAEIALTKHRHIAAAIRSTALLVVAGLACLVLSAGTG